MDLNLLRVFEAVFRERHLTRAARALSVTPSAVSHALRRLREHLDEPLFEREGARMEPTAMCERVAPALLDQLAQLRSLLDRWGRFEPRESTQTFRVGLSESAEPMLVPGLCPSFFRAAPAASLVSMGFDRADLPRRLASRQMDVAIEIGLPTPPQVRHEPLLEDDLCVVVRRAHPIRRGLTLEQYRAARHIVVSARASGTVLEDIALAQFGIERQVSVRCRSYVTALRLVEQSNDLLTMPARVAQDLGRSLAVVRRPLPVRLPSVHLHVYWHANSDADPGNVWLRGLLHQSVSAAESKRVALARA
ncbi:MAG: LysR family transcriptional regulator [Polyangiaceae bacterium]